MSKSKPKDKKNDNSAVIQAQYQAQKRQLLESNFTLRKAHERLQSITKQNLQLTIQNQNIKKIYDEKIQQLTIKNETNEKRLMILSKDKTSLEIENSHKQSKLRMFEKQLYDEQQFRIKELEQYKKNVGFQINKYQSQLMEYKQYMNERDQLEAERVNLREQVWVEKTEKIKELADKQREKVQATDKLRDQMLKKIREMRTNLLSLKKQQLNTTTRLTILQNHQLTSQLQYQSKQTQKLVFKNQELQTKLTVFTRDLEIHKQVEEQLAKRSHLSKGIIKKLNLRIVQLQQQLQTYKCQTLKYNNTNNQQKQTTTRQADLQVMNVLDKQLEMTQRKFGQLQSRHEILKKQKEQLYNKLHKYENNSNKIAHILNNYYQMVKSDEQCHHISLQKLKNKKVEQWTNQQINIVIKILLNILKPYITKNNIPIPCIRKNLVLDDENSLLNTLQKKNSLPAMQSERKQFTIKHKIQDIPVNIASKIVASNLRDWGKTVNTSKSKLWRKYKINNSQSFRG